MIIHKQKVELKRKEMVKWDGCQHVKKIAKQQTCAVRRSMNMMSNIDQVISNVQHYAIYTNNHIFFFSIQQTHAPIPVMKYNVLQCSLMIDS